MFSQDTAGIEQPPGVERTDACVRRRGRAGAVSPAQLGRVYIGERDPGHPVMLVVGDDGTERLFAPALGEFDWGWPSMGGTRRLAQALLLDVTGREPPPGLRDALATEELAHFPWGAFSLTGRELIGWIEARGHTIADWPAVGSMPGPGRLFDASSPARDRFSRSPLASRVSRGRTPPRALLVAVGASR